MPLQVHEHIDVLMVRCMEGIATAEEQRALAAWLEQSAEHRAYMLQMERVYFGIPAAVAEYADVEEGWQKVNARTSTRVVPLKASHTWKYWAAALAIGIALFVGYRWNGERPAIERTYAATSTTIQDFLPDSTRIQLNKGTEIDYVQLKNGARIVKLEGEAFFEIHHSTSAPRNSFTVEAEGMRIEDIGTAFNVQALPGNDTVAVTVTDGKVIIHIPGETHEVEKGSTGLWIKSANRFELLTAPEEQNGAAWANKSLRFRNTRMDKVIRKLSDAYNVSVILADDDMNNCRLTAIFENETIDGLLSILCETMGWNFTPVAGGFVINGEGCVDRDALNTTE